jgi:arylsulfatase A-like enzyme
LSSGLVFLIERYLKQKLSLSFLVSVGAILLTSNYLILSWTPTKTLLKNGTYFNTIKKNELRGSLNKIAYPLTRPFTAGIKDYQMLLPDIPEGRKIIVLILDAFRYDYLDKTIHGQPSAPAMNQLAERNLNFENYRAQSSWTKPTIASLFTGLYVAEHQTYWGHTPPDSNQYQGHALPKKYSTLAERLNEAGYRTMGTVKSGHLSARYNYDQGFDLYLDLLNGFRGDFNSHKQVLFWLYHTTPRNAFIYVHINGPHEPFDLAYYNQDFLRETPYVREGQLKIPGRFSFTRQDTQRIEDPDLELTEKEVKYLRTLYAAKLNFYDQHYVKDFNGILKDIGIFEESLLTISADHGEGLYEHQEYSHGKNLYEEIIHIPLIMKFPTTVKARSNELDLNLETVDLTATLLDYTNANSNNISGISFLPYLLNKDEAQTRKSKFEYTYAEQAKDKPFVPSAAVISPPWKYIHNFLDNSGKLFHLGRDPLEQNPIENHPSIRNKLKKSLFKNIRSDSSISRERRRIREATEKGLEQFENLGYIN